MLIGAGIFNQFSPFLRVTPPKLPCGQVFALSEGTFASLKQSRAFRDRNRRTDALAHGPLETGCFANPSQSHLWKGHAR